MRTSLLLLSVLTAACGTDSLTGEPPLDPPTNPPGSDPADPDPEQPPLATGEARILFPPGAASATSAEKLHVRGTANASLVFVNGTLAFSDDGYATWSIELDLAAGENDITVSTTVDDERFDGVATTTTTRRALDFQRGAGQIRMLNDGVALVADRDRLLRVDLSSGERTRAISPSFPLGQDSSFALDPTGDRIFAVSGSSLYSLDAGTETALAFVPSFGGAAIAFDARRNRVLTGSEDGVEVVRLNTLVQFRLFREPVCALEVRDDTLFALVRAGSQSELMVHDLSTNATRRIPVGALPCGARHSSLALDVTAERVFVSNSIEIKEISIASEISRTVLAVPGADFLGRRPEFVTGLAYDAGADRLVVSRRDFQGFASVAAVDIASGALAPVVDPMFSRERAISALGSLPDGQLLVEGRAMIERLDLDTMLTTKVRSFDGHGEQGKVGIVGSSVLIGGIDHDSYPYDRFELVSDFGAGEVTYSRAGIFDTVVAGADADELFVIDEGLLIGLRPSDNVLRTFPIHSGRVAVLDLPHNRALAIGDGCVVRATDLTTATDSCAVTGEATGRLLAVRGNTVLFESDDGIRAVNLTTFDSKRLGGAGFELGRTTTSASFYDAARDVLVVSKTDLSVPIFVDPVSGDRVVPIAR